MASSVHVLTVWAHSKCRGLAVQHQLRGMCVARSCYARSAAFRLARPLGRRTNSRPVCARSEALECVQLVAAFAHASLLAAGGCREVPPVKGAGQRGPRRQCRKQASGPGVTTFRAPFRWFRRLTKWRGGQIQTSHNPVSREFARVRHFCGIENCRQPVANFGRADQMLGGAPMHRGDPGRRVPSGAPVVQRPT